MGRWFHRRSLRRNLLLWLVAPLLGVAALNLIEARFQANKTATLVTDRLLLASARVIAEQVRDVEGRVEASIPPAALEMFASPSHDKVIYQVRDPAGTLVAGYPDVKRPKTPLVDGQPVQFDAIFRVEAVRGLELTQPVASHARPATVTVLTTLRARDAMRWQLWLAAIRDQLLLVALAGALILVGLQRGLAPLRAVSHEVERRGARSLVPVSFDPVPVELHPLLAALNGALGRVGQHVALQRRFIANAAHQLRTPLAVLKTQAAVGLREAEPQAKDEALAALEAGADGLARLVHQLLTLARAEPGGSARRELLDAAAPTRAALEPIALTALDRGVDLVLNADDGTVWVEGHVSLLGEMVTNLVSNALEATPSGGTIEVGIASREAWAEWTVADTGPGIAEAERDRVFERFYRSPGSPPGGTGLGLAIVAEIVEAHGGRIALEERVPPPGLLVRVSLPSKPGRGAASGRASAPGQG